ncbi:D-alanyl-D-alanine carboxypeptidase [Microbacterium sp. NPDC056234]|uniref:D-alanyl-D-alanine carboxypeptidase n=1 Tax=Microbacterium sp. NPDC056234 TaxID=3345757 RepID=UPI0035DDC362
MTLDEQTDESGALTRRELRRRTGAIPVATDSDADGTVDTTAVDSDDLDTPTTPVAVVPAAVATGTVAEERVAAPVVAKRMDADAGAESAESGSSGSAAEGAVAASASEAGEPETTDADAELAALLAAQAEPVRPAAAWADENSPATALLWVNPIDVEAATQAAPLEAPTATADEPDLLVGAPRRGFLQPGILVPLGTLAALGVAYAATTLLWPLHELPPTIEAVAVTPAGATAADIAWPAVGSAGVGVEGVSTAASTTETAPIASVTKVVSAMLVLDAMPLQPGEQGPEFDFDYSDTVEYWSYRSDDQSALDVPVGGTLTEYQMLQGILLGSANNYIDRLSDEIWGSDREFAAAAEQWLAARGLNDITVVTPSGRNDRNVASPASLTALASIAMSNPVFAEIVGTSTVELPGAGLVTNSNGLLGEPGIVGIKTGSLDDDYNLLSAKDVTVGDTDVRIYAAVLGQESDEERLAASRALYEQVEAQLQAQGPAVTAETVVGEVSTPWGATADIVTDADANVVLWNTTAPTAEVSFDLGDNRDADADVGSMTVAGPVNTVEIPVVLSEELSGPSAWWRLTHPFELLGITD